MSTAAFSGNSNPLNNHVKWQKAKRTELDNSLVELINIKILSPLLLLDQHEFGLGNIEFAGPKEPEKTRVVVSESVKPSLIFQFLSQLIEGLLLRCLFDRPVLELVQTTSSYKILTVR